MPATPAPVPFEHLVVVDLGPTPEEMADALEFFAWRREFLAECEERWPDDGAADEAKAVRDLRRDTAEAEAMLARPAQLADAFVIDTLDLGALETPLLMLQVAKRIDELSAMLAARQAQLLVEVAEPTASEHYLHEVHLETEVALARTVSPAAAGLDIALARSLATDFPQFRDALARGEVSVAHCRKLVELTGLVQSDEVRRRIGELALPKAAERTVGLFGQAVRRLVVRHDRDALARRADAITTKRDVQVRRLDDGLGQLVYTDEWTKVAAVERRIRTAGRATQLHRKRDAAAEKARAEGVESPSQGGERSKVKQARKIAASEHHTHAGWSQAFLTASGCRADALLAIVLGREHDDGTIVQERGEDAVRVNVEVVIGLETLRGEADRIALLDGEPVPADVARHWAKHARTFRRMVTDPVTGHLLDRGKVYMADDVRDFVLARDGRCRVPVCGIKHRDRLQADHAEPAPDGATSTANLGALSTTHHQLKTDGYLDITDSQADGSATLTTLWGQRIEVPPRPYLDEPDLTGWDHTAPDGDGWAPAGTGRRNDDRLSRGAPPPF